jgi:hypothetical protein
MLEMYTTDRLMNSPTPMSRGQAPDFLNDPNDETMRSNHPKSNPSPGKLIVI